MSALFHQVFCFLLDGPSRPLVHFDMVGDDEGGPIDEWLRAGGRAELLEPTSIIELHHGRGRDELVHRALKDFRAQALPVKGERVAHLARLPDSGGPSPCDPALEMTSGRLLARLLPELPEASFRY